MSRTRFRIVIFLLGLACCPAAAKAASVKDTIKLGWQVPWATQGQLVMALRNTNALALVGQDVEFVGFSYGAPLNSAALAGKVDVLLTADQPAITLLGRDPSFRIVARMMYNQACIYVSSKSKTTKLNELAGRTVMGPVGAAAERIAVNALKNAGVDLGTVKFGQLDMAQQASMLRRSAGEGRWPDVDALYGFDPFPAVFEEA
jgi:sulfonate transport system substrate-binding protein